MSLRVVVVCCAIFAISGNELQATTIEWGAEFSGFRQGDVYFASTIEFSTSGLDRPVTLFSYSPDDDVIREIIDLNAPFGSPNAQLAYDATSEGLLIGDITKVQFLDQDGDLSLWSDELGTTDITVDQFGSVYTGRGSISKTDASVNTTTFYDDETITPRGIAVNTDEVLVGIDLRSDAQPFGTDNILRLDLDGNIRETLRTTNIGGAGLVRSFSDGTYAVVSNERTMVSRLNVDGSFAVIADSSDGIFQTDGITIDGDDDVWITTRGRPATLQEFDLSGNSLTSIQLELDALMGTSDPGFFSPSGVVVIPEVASSVSEPNAWGLLVAGLLGIGLIRRRGAGKSIVDVN